MTADEAEFACCVQTSVPRPSKLDRCAGWLHKAAGLRGRGIK
jgi:hypothetical protein